VNIRARKLDVIVVYKVDRLTRSLADFAGSTNPIYSLTSWVRPLSFFLGVSPIPRYVLPTRMLRSRGLHALLIA
jgi:hypothetical protein